MHDAICRSCNNQQYSMYKLKSSPPVCVKCCRPWGWSSICEGDCEQVSVKFWYHMYINHAENWLVDRLLCSLTKYLLPWSIRHSIAGKFMSQTKLNSIQHQFLHYQRLIAKRPSDISRRSFTIRNAKYKSQVMLVMRKVAFWGAHTAAL